MQAFLGRSETIMEINDQLDWVVQQLIGVGQDYSNTQDLNGINMH